jgi:hypothetical protein
VHFYDIRYVRHAFDTSSLCMTKELIPHYAG